MNYAVFYFTIPNVSFLKKKKAVCCYKYKHTTKIAVFISSKLISKMANKFNKFVFLPFDMPQYISFSSL